MLDSKLDVIQNGYRLNICIVLQNPLGQVLIAQRHDHRNAWQFPQGGIMKGESPVQALFRELYEEIGLRPCDVTVEGHSSRWIHYRIPPSRQPLKSGAIGQKQRWYLLSLRSADHVIDLIKGSYEPEFVRWRWVEYWEPFHRITHFKRHAYQQGLGSLQSFVAYRAD